MVSKTEMRVAQFWGFFHVVAVAGMACYAGLSHVVLTIAVAVVFALLADVPEEVGKRRDRYALGRRAAQGLGWKRTAYSYRACSRRD